MGKIIHYRILSVSIKMSWQIVTAQKCTKAVDAKFKILFTVLK